MANIMSQIKLRNKPSRNGFDLSKKNAFTAKVGELLPVYCKEVLPGDKFNINAKWLSRTQPVNTAAFTRIREYFDFFFVPTTLLWNKFGTFVTQQNKDLMKAVGIAGTDSLLQDKQPYMTVNQIVTYLQSAASTDNDMGFSKSYTTSKLLHYLGYGDFHSSWGTSALTPRVNAELNPFPLMAYQKIYQDYFRNQQWERSAPNTCNCDYITGLTGSSLNLPISSISSVRKNMFDLQYCNWNKDYFTGLLPNSQYGDAASISLSASGNLNLTLDETTATDSFYVFSNATADDTLKTYNSTAGPTGTTRVGFVNNGPSGFILSADSVNVIRNAMGLTTTSSTVDLQNTFTILALRQAQAKQKWAEITQSQRHDYKSQVDAHFGVSMSDAYSDYSTYLGGINSNIDISEVVNQNLTGSNDSNIAGKGVGVGQGGINFTAQTHGYIMCIYHAVPLLDYAITGVKRQNLKTTFIDYAVPEFDATGMVQVPAIELTNSQINGLANDAKLGYAPRYVDYKTDIDEVHGAFFNGGLESWVAPFGDTYIKAFINAIGGSAFTGINYKFLKVSPSVVNPIFGVSAGDDVDTDQLLVNSYFDVKAVRNLDVNGLPY